MNNTTSSKFNKSEKLGHGYIDGDTFGKVITAENQFLKYPPAICISEDDLTQVMRRGLHHIQVTNQINGDMYSTSLDDFLSHSFPIQRGNCEPQRAMKLEDWAKVSPLVYESKALKAGQVRENDGKPRQLSLFEGGAK